MTDNAIPTSEREMLASMRQYIDAADAIARHERRINRRLLRRNLYLERTPCGYCITDRYSSLCEAKNLSLDAAEEWAAEHIPGGSRCA